MEQPGEKKLRITSFVVHATRGLIRDQTARRRTMFVALVVALVLLCAGATFLQPLLIAHPVWFILFWFVCAWLTMLATLLAFFDVLVLRAQTRALRKALQKELSSTDRSSGAPDRQ
jgi:protein-S-isoprenylcysteine O-methyltransferase Ste14